MHVCFFALGWIIKTAEEKVVVSLLDTSRSVPYIKYIQPSHRSEFLVYLQITHIYEDISVYIYIYVSSDVTYSVKKGHVHV